MRTLTNTEVAYTAGAEGVPLSVVASTIVGGVIGAFMNGALHEITLMTYQNTCEQAGGADCFINAAYYASTHVAPRLIPHVMMFATIGLILGTAYALNKTR